MFSKLLYFEEKFRLGDHLEWQDSDVEPSSLFPHAIAAVCSFWKDIMSSVPQFWTRLMVFVDSPTIPQLVITSQLSWSRDLPLDVIVIRRNLDHVVDSQHERKHVMSLMETVINPRIHRLRKLASTSDSAPPSPHFLTIFTALRSS